MRLCRPQREGAQGVDAPFRRADYSDLMISGAFAPSAASARLSPGQSCPMPDFGREVPSRGNEGQVDEP